MILQPGVNEGVSNADYHADRNYLSSSAYKLLLKSAKEFESKYILETVEEEQKENPAFSEGSLVHSYILEPHLVDKEYAFFPGFRKAGVEFQKFKAKNRDKTIISASQKTRCLKCVDNYNENDAAVALVDGGFPEHTICGDFMGINSKVRTDYINVEKGYIADVKTTAWGSDQATFRDTVLRYRYDLSAVLYAEICKQYYGKDFDFYFIVLSKKEPTCDVFKLSEKSYDKGYQDLVKAAKKYKQCKESGIWLDESDIAKKEINNSEYEILEV
jgi:exodeoxyribonuclease VIII